MSNLRTAAQQALEALEFLSLDFFMLDPSSPGLEAGNKAIAALRAALAEPVQEPVAWVLALPDGKLDRLSVVAYDDEAEEMLQRSIAGCTLVPLYTSPPQRKPLTEEEIRRIKPVSPGLVDFRSGVRCAERAHEIGGNDE